MSRIIYTVIAPCRLNLRCLVSDIFGLLVEVSSWRDWVGCVESVGTSVLARFILKLFWSLKEDKPLSGAWSYSSISPLSPFICSILNPWIWHLFIWCIYIKVVIAFYLFGGEISWYLWSSNFLVFSLLSSYLRVPL